MAAPPSCQVVDEDAEFNGAGVDEFFTGCSMDNVGRDYQVVAIMGPQSSGKSTLLNSVVRPPPALPPPDSSWEWQGPKRVGMSGEGAVLPQQRSRIRSLTRLAAVHALFKGASSTKEQPRLLGIRSEVGATTPPTTSCHMNHRMLCSLAPRSRR